MILFLSETNKMKNQLEVIRSNSDNLTTLAGDLNTGLNKTKTNLTEIQTECNTIPGATFCDRVDASQLAADADFTNLPNVTEQLQNIQDVVNQNFTKSAQEVITAFLGKLSKLQYAYRTHQTTNQMVLCSCTPSPTSKGGAFIAISHPGIYPAVKMILRFKSYFSCLSHIMLTPAS